MTLGGFKKETAQIILDVVQYLRENGFVIKRPGRGEQFVPPDAPIYVRNDSGEEIPPFACMQTSDTVDTSGQNYVVVVKPVDDDGSSGKYLFNSIAPIEVDGYGVSYAGPLVRMLTDGSAITCGDSWQPEVGEWAVTPGGSLFTAVGEDDIETDVMRAFVNSGGGGAATIQFTVDSVATAGSSSPYNGKQVATVTIEVAPCSRSELIGTTAEVVDWSGCVWDLAEADLIGVWGWATECVALSLKSGDPPGTLTPCHWGADDRCCLPEDV